MKASFKGIIAFEGLLVLYFFRIAHSEHILFLHTCVTYSHRVSTWPLVEALLANGHSVTFMGPYSGVGERSADPRVTDIILKNLTKFMDQVTSTSFDVSNRASGVTPKFIMVYDSLCLTACQVAFESSEFQDWLSSEPKVDLIFSDTSSECSYGLASKLKSKHALILPITFLSKHFEAFGITPDSSSIPDWDVTYKLPLSFFNRLIGFLIPLAWRLSQTHHFPSYQSLFRKSLELQGYLNLDEILSNTSFILINGDYIEDYPRSYPPFVVKVPGLHVKTTHKPLDKDLGNFINSNDADGFMYISFGTVAKASNLPLSIREVFFKSIEAFPRIRFIWRWEGDVPTVYPKNLYLKRWVEQEDLLAHPKILGFLTQAGRPSMQESFYNGVPTITFPILGDQDFNAHRYEILGTSINCDIVGITEKKLKSAIAELLSNNRYKKRTKQLAILAKDVPMNSVDVALWWTEFVLRHTQEELSLMKLLGQKQSWIVRNQLDVLLFILLLILAFIFLLYNITRWTCKQLFCKSTLNQINKKAKTD